MKEASSISEARRLMSFVRLPVCPSARLLACLLRCVGPICWPFGRPTIDKRTAAAAAETFELSTTFRTIQNSIANLAQRSRLLDKMVLLAVSSAVNSISFGGHSI